MLTLWEIVTERYNLSADAWSFPVTAFDVVSMVSRRDIQPLFMDKHVIRHSSPTTVQVDRRQAIVVDQFGAFTACKMYEHVDQCHQLGR